MCQPLCVRLQRRQGASPEQGLQLAPIAERSLGQGYGRGSLTLPGVECRHDASKLGRHLADVGQMGDLPKFRFRRLDPPTHLGRVVLQPAPGFDRRPQARSAGRLAGQFRARLAIGQIQFVAGLRAEGRIDVARRKEFDQGRFGGLFGSPAICLQLDPGDQPDLARVRASVSLGELAQPRARGGQAGLGCEGARGLAVGLAVCTVATSRRPIRLARPGQSPCSVVRGATRQAQPGDQEQQPDHGPTSRPDGARERTAQDASQDERPAHCCSPGADPQRLLAPSDAARSRCPGQQPPGRTRRPSLRARRLRRFRRFQSSGQIQERRGIETSGHRYGRLRRRRVEQSEGFLASVEFGLGADHHLGRGQIAGRFRRQARQFLLQHVGRVPTEDDRAGPSFPGVEGGRYPLAHVVA